MKRLTTMFCAVCFLVMGFILSNNKTSMSPAVATMNAAEPNNNILQSLRIPTDLKLSQGTKIAQDTVTIHDTVYAKRAVRVVKVPYVIKSKDTLFVPVLYVPVNFPVREEQTVNDNHSTNKQLQDSCVCLRGNGLVH